MGTISAKLAYLAETKGLIKAAIEAKGVTIPEGATLRQYVSLIGDISGNTSIEFFKITNVNVSNDGQYTLTFKDGSTVTGSVTFNDSGAPVSLTDDQGNAVTFLGGIPTGVTDSEGNSITITG